MKKIFIKFLNGRGSKSLPLTVFLAEKTESNYDTVNKRGASSFFMLVKYNNVFKLDKKLLKCRKCF